MAKEKSELKFSNQGTVDRKYNVTGSGEQHFATNRIVRSDAHFTRATFNGALKKASRRVSAPASRKTGT